MFCERTSPVVQIPGWNALICQTTQHLQLHLWRMAVEKIHSSKVIRSVLGPDTSNTEVDVQIRHVISCAGLSKAAVTGVLEQRPLFEPAAHKDPPLTQRLAVLHYGPVENVPIYQPVNGDITGTWGTEPDFISHQTHRAPARCRSACSVVFMQCTSHLLLPFICIRVVRQVLLVNILTSGESKKPDQHWRHFSGFIKIPCQL